MIRLLYLLLLPNHLKSKVFEDQSFWVKGCSCSSFPTTSAPSGRQAMIGGGGIGPFEYPKNVELNSTLISSGTVCVLRIRKEMTEIQASQAMKGVL